MSKAGKLANQLADEIARIEAQSDLIEIDNYVWCETFMTAHRDRGSFASACVGESHVPLYIRKRRNSKV